MNTVTSSARLFEASSRCVRIADGQPHGGTSTRAPLSAPSVAGMPWLQVRTLEAITQALEAGGVSASAYGAVRRAAAPTVTSTHIEVRIGPRPTRRCETTRKEPIR
jgi:hypothetical protein